MTNPNRFAFVQDTRWCSGILRQLAIVGPATIAQIEQGVHSFAIPPASEPPTTEFGGEFDLDTQCVIVEGLVELRGDNNLHITSLGREAITALGLQVNEV